MHFLHPNDVAMEPVDSAREAGTPAEGNTRLIGHSTLVELHATPETILPESKCSLLRRAYPIGRAVKSLLLHTVLAVSLSESKCSHRLCFSARAPLVDFSESKCSPALCFPAHADVPECDGPD